MNLYAYAQIDELEEIAKENGIDCPRLRGYELMLDAQPFDILPGISKEERKQCKTYNKYVGRNDILFIHARIGGGNWDYYKDKVVNQPWFIEKVDDSFDSTYCDIYAKIKPIKSEDK